MTDYAPDEEALVLEISDLERRLKDVHARLEQSRSTIKSSNTTTTTTIEQQQQQQHQLSSPSSYPLSSIPPATLHELLILSDSALPLGSFAFSSGLESYLAHHPSRPAVNTPTKTTTPPSFHTFLSLSLASLASTTLPYLRAAHTTPDALRDLDNDLDASVACTVARRASIAQGRALVGVWERSLRAQRKEQKQYQQQQGGEARQVLEAFARELKGQAAARDDEVDVWAVNGHLPPLMGVVCRVLNVPLEHALYMYLLNHAKTLLSAGVRASVLGPYQAQGILASEGLKETVRDLVEDELKNGRGVDEAGQSVPVLDLWGGRHEIIYSRIFNS